MQAVAKKEGQNINIEPWDYRYYAEKVRKARFDVDDRELRRDGETYTYDTLSEIRKERGAQTPMVFLSGSDATYLFEAGVRFNVGSAIERFDR